MNYQQGCYGEIGAPESLYIFWRNMARHHYPGADDMEAYFREKTEQAQMAMQMQQMGGAGMGGGAPGNMEQISADAAAAIARSDAQEQAQNLYINGGGRDALS